MASIINAATSGGLVTTADTSGILQLQTAGTTAVTVDASQNVGIGGAVTNEGGYARCLQVTGSTDCTLELKAGSDFSVLAQNGSTLQIRNNATAGAMTFSTVSTERARFNATGALVFAGGTTTANGIGITFPATQSASSDANTLDDYEEGTWSPSIGGSTTYTVQDGYYTKCGNVVTVTGRMQINLLSGNANTYQITNLPFTSKNTSNGSKAGGGSVGYWSSTAINVISLQTYVETNTTNLAFQYLASAASAALTATIFGNSTDVYFTATYLT